ncbi:hypothetical protein E308F_29980 [Moorella sp. E308F]|uniref:hypothetical protein n=1 Tax=Moorella sp. E308F TaxID=2572682 RepID=UPI0010FFB0A2|nr:hypothetical protein [Moorella sp. E308F]GEA16752.1 hypothetical protein E308F_29980 [Moorella sp. E308F]
MAKKMKKEGVEEIFNQIQEGIEEEKSLEEVSVREVKLGVSELLVVDILPEVRQVVVENLGGGDVYVDPKAIAFTPDKCVAPGGKVVFEGVKKVFLEATSRPVVKISQFK